MSRPKSSLISTVQNNVDNFRTPALIYFESIIDANINNLQEITNQLGAKLIYSVKANTSPTILKKISPQVHGFDASSIEEAHIIREILGKKAQIYVTYPGISLDHIKELIKIKPVLVNIDSITALRKIPNNFHGFRLGLRVNPLIETKSYKLYKSGSKKSRLGIPINKLDLAFKTCKEKGIRSIGLHFHITCRSKSLNYQILALKKISQYLHLSKTKIK